MQSRLWISSALTDMSVGSLTPDCVQPNHPAQTRLKSGSSRPTNDSPALLIGSSAPLAAMPSGLTDCRMSYTVMTANGRIKTISAQVS